MENKIVISKGKQLARIMRTFNIKPKYNVSGRVNLSWFHDELLRKLRTGCGFQINTNNARKWLQNKKELFV